MDKRLGLALMIAGVVAAVALVVFSAVRSFAPPQKPVITDPALPVYGRRTKENPTGLISGKPDEGHPTR